MSRYSKTYTSSIISSESTTDNGAAQTIPCGDGPAHPSASIRVVKDGDVVRCIHVRCSCGETTSVVCNYD